MATPDEMNDLVFPDILTELATPSKRLYEKTMEFPIGSTPITYQLHGQHCPMSIGQVSPLMTVPSSDVASCEGASCVKDTNTDAIFWFVPPAQIFKIECTTGKHLLTKNLDSMLPVYGLKLVHIGDTSLLTVLLGDRASPAPVDTYPAWTLSDRYGSAWLLLDTETLEPFFDVTYALANCQRPLLSLHRWNDFFPEQCACDVLFCEPSDLRAPLTWVNDGELHRTVEDTTGFVNEHIGWLPYDSSDTSPYMIVSHPCLMGFYVVNLLNPLVMTACYRIPCPDECFLGVRGGLVLESDDGSFFTCVVVVQTEDTLTSKRTTKLMTGRFFIACEIVQDFVAVCLHDVDLGFTGHVSFDQRCIILSREESCYLSDRYEFIEAKVDNGFLRTIRSYLKLEYPAAIPSASVLVTTTDQSTALGINRSSAVSLQADLGVPLSFSFSQRERLSVVCWIDPVTRNTVFFCCGKFAQLSDTKFVSFLGIAKSPS